MTENPLPKKVVDRIFCSSSENMKELPDSCVALTVTSPPYNVGKEYDKNLSMEEYLGLLERIMNEVYRVLVTGGRAAINMANIGRKPYIPLTNYVTKIMDKVGFDMIGEFIWNKGASAGVSTAWGSWKSASNPVLRDVHEWILVFSKGLSERNAENRESTITDAELMEYTQSIWSIHTASAKRIGHPAPFPEDLPRRLIQLYTFRGDVVLDPFCGSGTTCIAALKAGRHYVGYDTEKRYCELAEKRIRECFTQPSPNTTPRSDKNESEQTKNKKKRTTQSKRSPKQHRLITDKNEG